MLVKLLSLTYQCIVRECESAIKAWEVLKTFFVKKKLHNRVQLWKELHEIVMETGVSLMGHLLEFDELCIRLGAAGDSMDYDKQQFYCWEGYYPNMMIWCALLRRTATRRCWKQKRCSAGNMTLFRSESKRKPL